MIGAQNSIPSHGKFPLKYQACLTIWPAAPFSITGAQVPICPTGISGFQRLNMSEPHQWRSSVQHEDPAQDQQAPGVQFIVRHDHAAGGTRAGQAHHVFRSDVGGKNRCADDPPAQIAAGQEVIAGRVLCFADHPGSHAQQDAEVEADHQPSRFP